MFSPLPHPTSPQAHWAYVCMLSHFFSHLWPCVTPWIISHLAPLSMGFFRKKYWRWFPCSSPGDLPDPGIESVGKIRWPEVLQSDRKLQEMITDDLLHLRGGRHPAQCQWLSALWVASFWLCSWQPGDSSVKTPLDPALSLSLLFNSHQFYELPVSPPINYS